MGIKSTNDQAGLYYRDLLMKQIISFQLPRKPAQDEYMAAFSEFLFECSNAYPYNLMYLIEQHKSFNDFLQIAHIKYQTLKNVLFQAKQVTFLLELIREHPSAAAKIKFKLNAFLEGSLDGSICLMEEFSMSGAKRRLSDDVLTVCYEKENRSCLIIHSTSLLEELLKAVLPSKLQTGGAEDGKATSKTSK
ncbi:hypothetical protein LJB68_12250 [bacterium 210820-DFI.6.52]|nr:hypothetical protein [bacterium 210820-DFI.6.52]